MFLLQRYYVPLLVMFVVFFDELFVCVLIASGTIVDSGMKMLEAILLATFSYVLMLRDIINNKIVSKERQILSFLSLLLILYLLTSFFYDVNSEYITYLLVYGSECISAAYIGILASRENVLSRVNNILPFFILILSVLIGMIGVAAAMAGTTVDTNSGFGVDADLNYQSLSYFMSYGYTYCFYYVFFVKLKPCLKNKMLKIAMIIDMLFCIIVCLLGGGRGAFVYISAVSLFMLIYYVKNSNGNRVQTLLIVSFLVVLSLCVILYFGVMESAGMGRVLGSLTEDDIRKDIYGNAINAFLSSPFIGCGLGSIWFTVGIYSHNMFLDLLAEIGLIGATILLYIIWKVLVKLYMLSKIDKHNLFVLFVYMGSLFMCLFSGYWLASLKLFFVCSFVHCLSDKTDSCVANV